MSALAGALGGLAGWTAMEGYWPTATALLGGDPRQQAMEEARAKGKQVPEESTTTRAGRIIYQTVTKSEPGSRTKTYLSYGFSLTYTLAVSALYGVLRHRFPPIRFGFGVGFGALMWLLGDEIIMWLTGLAAPPHLYPPKLHVHSAAAHSIFGAVLEGVAGGVEAALHER